MNPFIDDLTQSYDQMLAQASADPQGDCGCGCSGMTDAPSADDIDIALDSLANAPSDDEEDIDAALEALEVAEEDEEPAVESADLDSLIELLRATPGLKLTLSF